MYLKNNIQFRIVSSLAKSHFLQTQHYYLKLIADDAESFDSYSKEMILLNFELWFKFLNRLEKFYIFTSKQVDVDHLLYEFKHTDSEIQDIIRIHIDSFNRQDKELKILNSITRIFYTFLEQIIPTFKTNEEIFSYITKMISLYIQNKIHVIFDLHNCNISATDFCIELHKANINLLSILANLYHEYNPNIKAFKIKNYLASDIPDDLLDGFKMNGYRIDSIK